MGRDMELAEHGYDGIIDHGFNNGNERRSIGIIGVGGNGLHSWRSECFEIGNRGWHGVDVGLWSV
jgi:hypothetical protein